MRRILAGIAALAIGVGGAAAALTIGATSAFADPSGHTWYRLRMCESSDNYQTDTGNGYYGAYQFDLSTWRSVGGHGYPDNASPAEQDARALILYRERGWQPWTCASILGLKPDKDAGSGRISDIHVPGTGGHRTHGIPEFPGTHWYYYGDNNVHIKAFQNEMHRRGYFPAGTGQYGPLTLHMVKKLQRLNGLPVTGYIGPNTWRLAWTGKYTTKHHTPRTHKPRHHNPRRHVPPFPGGKTWRGWYYYGDNNVHIKAFQNEMHRRGYFPAGTGQYGPLTLRMVKKLQRLNGLTPTGAIGPHTWRLGWVGKY